MSARDKLAEIIRDAENCTDEEGSWALPEDVADAVVAAGWRPPVRVIETVEALPNNEERAIPQEAVEAAELERSINAFLHTLSEQECNVFLRRYWFVEEYAEIAGRYGMNLNTVKTSLFRTRKKLQKYLEQQGIVL